MIHIDVCRKRDYAADYPPIVVQTSTDGAGWRTHYEFYLQVEDIERLGIEGATEATQERARDCARVFANGCRYAGAEVRTTAFGYTL